MVARVLEYESWHKLPEYMDGVIANMRPGTSRVCVVENEQGEIVARWMLYPVLFAEDLWIDPRYRKQVSVGRKLWRLVYRCASELGFSRMVSTVVDESVVPLVVTLNAETMPTMVTFPVRGQ